jgi:hybrid cluster-associated redox disulfide protein
MVDKITKDMKFSEILEKYPNIAPIFLKNGLSCIGCPMAAQETIEQGAKAHGVSVDKLLEELNTELNKE